MTSITLSFLPIHESVHVYLNGLEQYETTDWILDDSTGVITCQSGMGELSSDLIEVRYTHLGDSV